MKFKSLGPQGPYKSSSSKKDLANARARFPSVDK